MPVYGGSSYVRQIRALKQGAQMVVGTPGRVLDLIGRKDLKLEALKMLIFDEADKMLDMGFRDDIDTLMISAPKERQTICFSATFSKQIRNLINTYTENPATITIEHKALTVPTVEQRYYEVRGRSKLETLCRVLDVEDAQKAIVFTNTKRAADEITDAGNDLRINVIMRQNDGIFLFFKRVDLINDGCHILALLFRKGSPTPELNMLQFVVE